MRTLGLTLSMMALFLVGCSKQAAQQAQQTPQTPGNYRATWKSVPELQDVMDAMVEVNSEILWGVANDDKVPKTGEDWEKLDHAAITLIETGKFIKTSPLAKDNPDWPKDADKLIANGETARAAVKEKNLTKLLAAGDDLVMVCADCHNRYFEDQ